MSLSVTQELWACHLHNIHVHRVFDIPTFLFAPISACFQSRSHSNELLSRLSVSSKVWVWVGALACWHALCLPPDRTLSTRLNYPLHDDSMQQSKKWRSPDSRVFRFFQMDSSGPPHAADQGGSRNIACYGSRLFDIQLIRKYQLRLDSFFYRSLCTTECVCMHVRTRVKDAHWIWWQTVKMFETQPTTCSKLKCWNLLLLRHCSILIKSPNMLMDDSGNSVHLRI